MSPGTEALDRVLPKLEGVKPSGDSGRQWTACCPAHADSRQSLGVALSDQGSVLLRCYAGCEVVNIVSSIGLALKDLFVGGKERRSPPGVSVAGIAFLKRLPLEFLKGVCHLRDEGPPAARTVKIPYRDVNGDILFERTRTAAKAKDGTWQPRGTKLRAYGLWRLAEFRPGGRLIFVEGESDCWALWHHGYPAIGLPGAAAIKALSEHDVTGFTQAFLWHEPDHGGEGFARGLMARLKTFGIAPQIISSPTAKDPCDLHQRDPDGFKAAFEAILAKPTALLPVAVTVAANQPGGRPLTDKGNAERLVDRFGDDLKYLTMNSSGQWYAWDGKRFREDARNSIQERAKDTVTGIYVEAGKEQDPTRRGQLIAHGKASESARSIACIPKLASSDPRVVVEPDQLNANKDLLNCLNGTIELKTGEFRDHRRADLITCLAPVEYDESATCPTWESTLNLIFPVDPKDPSKGGNKGLIEYVQRLLGQSITGHYSTTFPILHGNGSNGKSTIINTMIDILGGDYAMQGPPGFLMEKKFESHPTEIADLYGKRFVSISETKSGGKMDVSLAKMATGGERLRAHKMRKDNFEFEATFTLFLSTNHRPRITDTDDGIWRRVALIPFTAKFWNPERNESGTEEYRLNKGMRAKLAVERSGILKWLIQGAAAWYADGLTEPPEVRAFTEEYRTEENMFGRFLDEKVDQSGDGVSVAVAYLAYKKWAEASGERAWSKKAFSNEMKRSGIESSRGNGGVWMYKTISIHEESATAKPTSIDDVIPE